MLGHDPALLAKTLLLAVAMLPLLIDNVVNDRLTNLNNAILFAGGIGWLALEHNMGWSQTPLASHVLWIPFELVAILVGAVVVRLPFGCAKALMALTPWFSPTTLCVIGAVAFAIAGVVALGMRKKAYLFGPPLALASLAAVLLTRV